MYVPMIMILSISFNLGANPTDLMNAKFGQTYCSNSNECVLLNTELNSGVIASSIIIDFEINKKNIAVSDKAEDECVEIIEEDETLTEEPTEAAKENPLDTTTIPCIGCFDIEEETISSEVLNQEPVIIEDSTSDTNTIEQPSDSIEEEEDNVHNNNNYHEIDIIIPSIHKDDNNIERNNTYHVVEIRVPSIHE